MSNILRTEMPLLVRHEGIWVGTYRHVAPDLTVLDQHDFRIAVEFPEDGSCDYRQTSHYRWDDGRTDDIVFEASYRDKKLIWDYGRIKGELWAIDEATLYLWFTFTDQPDVRVYEMIQLSPDGRHRARTWHWLRQHALFQLTLVSERRESDG